MLSSLFVPKRFIIGIGFNDIETSRKARHYDLIFNYFDTGYFSAMWMDVQE